MTIGILNKLSIFLQKKIIKLNVVERIMFEVNGIKYEINSDGISVTVIKNTYTYSGIVIIPPQVQYLNNIYRVTTIGDCAFDGCSGITSLTIPDSVTSIGNRAFCGCNALTEIKSFAQVPPTCDNCAFDDINKEECILYVPKGRIYAYKQAVQWKNFVCIKEM